VTHVAWDPHKGELIQPRTAKRLESFEDAYTEDIALHTLNPEFADRSAEFAKARFLEWIWAGGNPELSTNAPESEG